MFFAYPAPLDSLMHVYQIFRSILLSIRSLFGSQTTLDQSFFTMEAVEQSQIDNPPI